LEGTRWESAEGGAKQRARKTRMFIVKSIGGHGERRDVERDGRGHLAFLEKNAKKRRVNSGA